MSRESLHTDALILAARNAVLDTLDAFACDSGMKNLPLGQEGAIDADLPALFKCIDEQVHRLVQRNKIAANQQR